MSREQAYEDALREIVKLGFAAEWRSVATANFLREVNWHWYVRAHAMAGNWMVVFDEAIAAGRRKEASDRVLLSEVR